MACGGVAILFWQGAFIPACRENSIYAEVRGWHEFLREKHPPSVMQQWYYSKNATQLGPVSIDELKAKLASGEVSGIDMVWREGLPDWKKAAEMPELLAPSIPQPANVVPQPSLAGTPVVTPYQPPVAQSYGSNMLIPNYLWQSIVVTIFCCWPLGIPAIVYAAKVDGLKARGDIQGALSASTSAKNWCWAAFGSWIVLIVIYILFFAVAGFGSLHSSN